MYAAQRPLTLARGILPPGDAGIHKTLGMMRQLALEGSKDLPVFEAARQIIRNVPGHQPGRELDALFRFVRDRVRFTRDIAGIETLQSPRYTLRTLSGDCDDRATLLVALARSIGIEANLRFRVAATNPVRPRSFSHVYVVARINGRDVALDPTYPANRMGFAPPASRIGDYRT